MARHLGKIKSCMNPNNLIILSIYCSYIRAVSDRTNTVVLTRSCKILGANSGMILTL